MLHLDPFQYGALYHIPIKNTIDTVLHFNPMTIDTFVIIHPLGDIGNSAMVKYGIISVVSLDPITGKMIIHKTQFIPMSVQYQVAPVSRAGNRLGRGKVNMVQAVTKSVENSINNEIIFNAKVAGIPKDDLLASVVTGVNPLIQTNADQLSAAAELVSKGGKLDRDDAVDMAYQVDSYRELVPQVIAKPRATPAATNVVEEAEKARMREIARQQELAKQVYAQLMSGRDRGEPSAREVQAAMEPLAHLDKV